MNNDEIEYRVLVRESTIKKIERITNQRYHNNFEKIVLDALSKVKK